MGRKVGGGRHGLLGIDWRVERADHLPWLMVGRWMAGSGEGEREGGADIADNECEWVSEWIWLVL